MNVNSRWLKRLLTLILAGVLLSVGYDLNAQNVSLARPSPVSSPLKGNEVKRIKRHWRQLKTQMNTFLRLRALGQSRSGASLKLLERRVDQVQVMIQRYFTAQLVTDRLTPERLRPIIRETLGMKGLFHLYDGRVCLRLPPRVELAKARVQRRDWTVAIEHWLEALRCGGSAELWKQVALGYDALNQPARAAQARERTNLKLGSIEIPPSMIQESQMNRSSTETTIPAQRGE